MAGLLKDAFEIALRDGAFYPWTKAPEYARRGMNASLDYPIILSAEGCVMGRMHRIMKAYLAGQTDVVAVQFAVNPEPDEIQPMPK